MAEIPHFRFSSLKRDLITMSANAIVVENLSKRYLIGHRRSQTEQYKYKALRDVIQREAIDFARKAADLIRGRQIVQGDEIEEFWALRDVNFEIKQGEVFGIIGRNGAGKSTLLKILARITDPTAGRVSLKGRVASLLEVGTGFHPELTGRENIFLNGAILGMTQGEIRRKFDEIVAFAEVEKFLDTPVKHYSSGMYVRLAFAVAAHLEPEILIVDEVLAVGDAEFQKKCLGKMDEVSRNQGRTVLFVSHNMEAVLRLCTRGILFESGRIRTIGDIDAVVSAYLSSQSSSPRLVDLSSTPRPEGFSGKARLVSVTASNPDGDWLIPYGQALSLDITVDVQAPATRVNLGIGVFSVRGFEIASWTSKCTDVRPSINSGMNTFRLAFPEMRLLPGRYWIDFAVWGDHGDLDRVNEAVQFEIVTSSASAEIDAEYFGGAIVPFATISVLK
jgi:lipopolysaccharide transport system ATP-binding protein